ncbi:hypothetical protein QZM66_06585 [Burkholderia contaminans]|uniref:hypothetical protein n=1 Tax=Burkholderia sp. HI4860 TaxID=2015361 RepID=UPI001F620805|nr:MULTISPECIES: hypothetical protein [Burkholderia]MCI3969192.1 hypothetical protein [Burkholderia sp. HI4860]MDN7787204.1 hypothetical protein [Burkholderia contaminans]
MRTVSTSAVRRFGAWAFGVSTSGPCDRWVGSPGSWAPGVCAFGAGDDGGGAPGIWGTGAGEFGIGVPDTCAVCIGASGGVAGVACSRFGGVAEGGASGAGEGEADVSDIVEAADVVASGGRAFSACASSIGAVDVCATGAGVFAVFAACADSVDRASGAAALDCGASGSTTTVVGRVGGCGFDACAICIDASEACAIGVGAWGGGGTSAWAIWIDTTVGCAPRGTASGAPWVPANSLTRPASGSPSAAKQGPDATSSNTSGACWRSRRLDGATVVHCCFRLLSTRCPPVETITSVARVTTHVVARRAAGLRAPGDADPTYSRLRIA